MLKPINKTLLHLYYHRLIRFCSHLTIVILCSNTDFAIILDDVNVTEQPETSCLQQNFWTFNDSICR